MSGETTNRIEAWELIRISCSLCMEELGWGTGVGEVWCDHCAKQSEDAEELESVEEP